MSISIDYPIGAPPPEGYTPVTAPNPRATGEAGWSPPTTGELADPFGGLQGDDRDAYVAITNTLKAYGLESLADDVLAFIRQGYSGDTVNILLQNTDAYKKRFAGNDARRQKGLPVLSPAEYLATEQMYRQVMSAAGLPIGFYDEPEDFTNWIAADVSPVEVQQRVQIASEWVNNLDPQAKQMAEQWYTSGDLIAYALDRDRATTVLERQYRASQIGGAATAQGVNVDQGLAERLASDGVTADAARQGFGAVRTIADNASRLSSIYGGDYDESDAISEVFQNDQEAAVKRRRLASQERAAFGGSSNVNSGSLARQTAGQT